MCLLLSLFSDPACMFVLVSGFSSRVLRVISTMSRSRICLFLFVPDLYFFILLLCGCYLEVLATLMLFLLMHQSVSSVQVLPHCFLL